MYHRKDYIAVLLTVLMVSFLLYTPCFGSIDTDNRDMALGIPLGGDKDAADKDICPQGVVVVNTFLRAWGENDYKTMYSLIDDSCKKDYPFNTAKIDFQVLHYRDYTISVIRKTGQNYEFLISSGDWESGNKDLEKIIINGKTFKIMMATKNSPFKRSLDSYF